MFHSPNLSINSENHLVIGQHDTVELAKKFGTPLYVLDEDLMRDNCRAYKNAIDTYYDGHGLVLFASKALCTMYTGRLVAEEGLGADVVSGGELYTLYKTGFPMEKVFFHGNNKTPDEIELALNCGVGHIVVDNKYELELLNLDDLSPSSMSARKLHRSSNQRANLYLMSCRRICCKPPASTYKK